MTPGFMPLAENCASMRSHCVPPVQQSLHFVSVPKFVTLSQPITSSHVYWPLFSRKINIRRGKTTKFLLKKRQKRLTICSILTDIANNMSAALELGGDIGDKADDEASDWGWTPLASAADAGNIQRVTELLADMDLDVDTRDYSGRTPLALATTKGHTHVAEQLLARGANPNLQDLRQAAPLWHAAKLGHIAIVRLLLASGRPLDMNQPSLPRRESFTPLCIAIKQGHRETADLLVRADDVDPSVKTGDLSDRAATHSVLGMALCEGYDDIALALLDKCHLRQGSGDNDATGDALEPASKLLVFAAGAGCIRFIRALLVKHLADVNAFYLCRETDWNSIGSFDQSPLIAASRKGHACVVRLLLDTKEIRPGLRKDGYHCTAPALIEAAKKGFLDVVQMLIADPRVEADQKDKGGRTALSHAAERGHEAVVAELLATQTVDPDRQDNWGQTPLRWAVEPREGFSLRPRLERPDEGVVRRLLASNRVNPNSRDKWGFTSLAYVSRNGFTGVVKAILEHPKTDPGSEGPHTPLAEAAIGGRADVVKVLLETGRVDVNSACVAGYHAPTSKEETALMLASEKGHEDVVRVLLSTPGIDPNIKNETGNTALMKAAEFGSLETVKLLLVAPGIDLNLQNQKGHTALHEAARNFYYGLLVIVKVEIMRALLGAPGINADIADNAGRTTLSLAAEAGNVEQVDILLSAGVNPDARDTAGRSPLLWVFTAEVRDAKQGSQFNSLRTDSHKEIARRLLLIQTVDPNAADAEGLTPLLLAIGLPHSREFVELLLTRPDLDLKQRGRDGLSPLDLATRLDKKDVMALLQSHGATASDEPMTGEPMPAERPRQQSSSHENGIISTLPDFGVAIPVLREIWDNRKGRHGGLIRKGLTTKNRLPLGTQHKYVADWTAESITGLLCPVCAAIDLDAAFSSRYDMHTVRVVADLGKVDKTWETRRCPLCRLFAAVHRPSGVNENHKLVSLSVSETWLYQDYLQNGRYPHHWYPSVDTVVLAVAADSILDCVLIESNSLDISQERKIISETVDSILAAGLIGRLGTNCPDQSNAVTVPRLACESNLGRAREWIRLCQQNHSPHCNPPRLATVPHLHLIECATRRILQQKELNADNPPQYVALSYVWGQPQPQKQQPQQSLDEEVEAVIEDAIRVTVELGYKYLWVDRYCIIQTGNEALKQEQLRHMHTVYANAEVTLVAAAGSSASAGLPGAPRHARSTQPAALIRGHGLVCIPPDPRYILPASTWATRGWTYQEGLFSRRRLFFSEHEMSYECNDMLCREALLLPPDARSRGQRLMSPFWMYKPGGLAEPELSPFVDYAEVKRSITGLFDVLATYSARQLSLPADALNAMLGILQRFSEYEARPVYHVCGVPILRIDDMIKRIKSDDYSDSDSTTAARLALDGFLSGLCWSLQQPANPRPGFPSWSWTGWEGVVENAATRIPLIRQAHGCPVDLSILPRDQDGGAILWNQYYNQLCVADNSKKDFWSGQNHILEITASMVTVWFHKVKRPVGKPTKWMGMVCAGDHVWDGRFWPTRKGDGDENDTDTLSSALLQKPYRGLVLGTEIERGNIVNTWVLVVQEQQQKPLLQQGQPGVDTHTYWERIGLLELRNCMPKDGKLERRTWRLV